MATTTILGTELELKQRKHNAEQANGEFSEITPPASDNERSDEMGKGMPLRANIAAPTEALVGSESDPYGYKNRKKTVSSALGVVLATSTELTFAGSGPRAALCVL